ncbi:DUF1642 domain-containing protein [Streptococcus suis]|uniref:DUF1642 domain-containing protein n=1 Tax=Streptococcus suis TaxID=1307 RepID=UPI00137B14FA|nr:DUF1642 domain-containing protein [Streptococcus suis]HEM6582858.1 DUF1642 domain-containing protein [Streptococcus suis]
MNGCTEFIPVTINETFADGVGVTVHSTTHPFRMMVKQVYRFPKQHQPQKVEVPAFIDSYIRYAKAEGMSLFIAMDNAQNKESEWIIKNEDIFTRAWLFGYQVEKERLYTVEVPSITDGMNMLHHSDNDWYFDEDINNSTSGDSRYHTKFDIEQAGFGWVFNCSGVKVVEVE